MSCVYFQKQNKKDGKRNNKMRANEKRFNEDTKEHVQNLLYV